MSDEDIRLAATEFAKQHRNEMAKDLTAMDRYLPDVAPVSVFMAGSPGAGKTEFSQGLIDILEEDTESHVVRIDGDEIRSRIPGYNGNNSHLFQGAVSLIVERMHDFVLRQKQSFVLDGTFSKYEKASDNIKRSLDKNRPVFIFYIYQKPEVAWKFTQAREKAEGRNIPKSAFIEQFVGAHETIRKVLIDFGDKVTIFFVKKDFEKNAVEDIFKISTGISQIDQYIGRVYAKDELEKYL